MMTLSVAGGSLSAQTANSQTVSHTAHSDGPTATGCVPHAEWQRLMETSPASVELLAQSRRELTAAANQLDAFISTASEARQTGWREFLAWKVLDQQLQQPQPNYRAMEVILQRYNRGYIGSGSNFRKFRRVRTALRRYTTRLQMVLGDEALNEANLASIQQGIENCTARLDAADSEAAQAKATQLRKQLRWDDLEQLSDAEALQTARYATLRNFAGVLSKTDTAPFDPTPFRQLGVAMLKRAEFLYVNREGSVREAYEARLARMKKALESPDKSDEQVAELLEDVDWLNDLGVAGDVPRTVLSCYRSNNLLIDISGHIVTTALVNEQTNSEFNDLCFHGAYVRGIAHSYVSSDAVLMPCDRGIAINLKMQGNSVSNTVGTKRRVDVCNRVETQLYGCKPLYWTPAGLTAGPTRANAPSKQYLQGVRVNRRFGTRLISRLAVRQTRRLQPEAEWVACCIARRKFIHRVNQEIGTRLQDANQQLKEQETQLRAQGLYPQSLSMFSTAQRAYVNATQAAKNRFGAWNPSPQLPGSSDVNVRVHQSLVGNVLAQRFGGQRFDQDSIVELIEEAGLKVPDELKGGGEDGQEPEKWSITLDRQLPISVSFMDGNVKIAIRGTRFVQGPENAKDAQVVEDAMEIVAQYKPEIVNGKVEAKLVGRVEAEYLDLERQGIAQIGVKTFMRRKVGSLFQQQFSEEDLPDSEMGDLADDVKVEHLLVTDHWLLVGADLDEAKLKEAIEEAQQPEPEQQEPAPNSQPDGYASTQPAS